MPIVGGLDVHRKQITFDYLDTETGQVRRGQISPADRAHPRAWLARWVQHSCPSLATPGHEGGSATRPARPMGRTTRLAQGRLRGVPRPRRNRTEGISRLL